MDRASKKQREVFDFIGAGVWYAVRHWPIAVGAGAGVYASHILGTALDRTGYASPVGYLFSLLPIVACTALGIWADRASLKQGSPAASEPEAEFIKEFLHVPFPFHSGAGKKRGVEKIWKEIDGLVGLAPVKQALREIAALVVADRERRKQGLPPLRQTLHMAFLGNPGTGKTTVARLTGELLAALGALPSGHIVETDRSGLVAGYIGQTALKVEEKVREAMGGVLFIDEAYSLARGSDDRDFGREAIDALVKAMEDYRDRLCVILAGYTGEMQKLFRANPGLESRTAFTLVFPDYSPSELVEIAKSYAGKRGWKLGPGTEERLLQTFTSDQHRIGELGNGRYARNIIEQAERKAAVRIACGQGLADTLLAEDFEG